ncbi:hypothetical protein HY636_01645 [Candidatus Woesearchaeota archaeon]|nr:hypothetical protein [Candidatus Woesearchaeota archaeon]
MKDLKKMAETEKKILGLSTIEFAFICILIIILYDVYTNQRAIAVAFLPIILAIRWIYVLIITKNFSLAWKSVVDLSKAPANIFRIILRMPPE